MAKCPVCNNEYTSASLSYCTHCGWDLTPYPPTLGDIPDAYRLKEQAKLSWAKQYYQSVQESLLQLREDNRIQHEELSKINQTQLEQIQNLETEKRDYEAQLSDFQQQLTQLQQQICLQQETQQNLNNHIQNLEKEKRDYKNQLFISQQQLTQLKQHICLQQQELNKAKQTIQPLNSRIHKLESKRNDQPQLSYKDQLPAEKLKTFTFKIVTVNKSGTKIKRQTKSAQYFTVDLGNGVKLDFVYIPGGAFMMGSPHGEGYDIEKPQHLVTIQPFFMGKYPVTQAQYQSIMGKNPSRFKGQNHPVERVSWDNAVDFCEQLSIKIGKSVTLPSEAQWEYVCRADTSTAFYFGETITAKLANYDSNYTYASETKEKYRQKTTPVGQFPPNAFGLYDLHGNVWEWCLDDWYDNYQEASNDGSARINYKNTKVVRGGSWFDDPRFCRSRVRARRSRVNAVSYVGFRVALLFVGE